MAGLPPIDHRAERLKRLEKRFYDKLDKRDTDLQDDIDDWFDTSMQEGEDGETSFLNGAVEFIKRYPQLKKLIGMNIDGMDDEQLITWLTTLTKTERRKVIEEFAAIRAKRNLLQTQIDFGIPIRDERKERKEQKGSGLENPYFGRMTLV